MRLSASPIIAKTEKVPSWLHPEELRPFKKAATSSYDIDVTYSVPPRTIFKIASASTMTSDAAQIVMKNIQPQFVVTHTVNHVGQVIKKSTPVIRYATQTTEKSSTVIKNGQYNITIPFSANISQLNSHSHIPQNLIEKVATQIEKTIPISFVVHNNGKIASVAIKGEAVTKKSNAPKYAAQFENLNAQYVPQTQIDRYTVYKAAAALEKFARGQGMISARARYVRATKAPKSANMQYVRSGDYVIEFYDTQGLLRKVEASLIIAPSGEFVLPTSFKTPDGASHQFSKDAVAALMSTPTIFTIDTYQRSNMPVYRKEDPTRFR